MTDALYWLVLSALATVFFTVPYVVERILRVGPWPALGYTNFGTGGFNQPEEQPAAWARRAYAAHINSVENLAVLAILVLTSHVTGLAGPLVATAAMVYFFARVAYYFAYVFAIPVLRTVLYFVTLGALLAMAFALLGWL